MIPTLIARFMNSPTIRAMRHSLLRSEQEAVAYIAQLHQTGPGLYTAPARRHRPSSSSLRRFLPTGLRRRPMAPTSSRHASVRADFSAR